MYSAQITKERIKQQCQEKKVIMKKMLSDLDMGVNAVIQINNSKGMASFSLARIADYLDCSVDYLLGRDTVVKNTVTSSNGVVIGQTNDHITINNGRDKELSKQELDLLRVYNAVDSKKQIDIMNYIYEVENGRS